MPSEVSPRRIAGTPNAISKIRLPPQLRSTIEALRSDPAAESAFELRVANVLAELSPKLARPPQHGASPRLATSKAAMSPRAHKVKEQRAEKRQHVTPARPPMMIDGTSGAGPGSKSSVQAPPDSERARIAPVEAEARLVIRAEPSPLSAPSTVPSSAEPSPKMSARRRAEAPGATDDALWEMRAISTIFDNAPTSGKGRGKHAREMQQYLQEVTDDANDTAVAASRVTRAQVPQKPAIVGLEGVDSHRQRKRLIAYALASMRG